MGKFVRRMVNQLINWSRRSVSRHWGDIGSIQYSYDELLYLHTGEEELTKDFYRELEIRQLT